MKKGNVVTDHLVLLLIVLVAGLLIIIGFSTNWGRGQDNIGDFFDVNASDDNLDEDGNFDPFGRNSLMLPLIPLYGTVLRRKKK